MVTEQCAVENPDAFRTIKRVGEPIDRDGDTPITLQQLAFVRAMQDHTPVVSDGKMQLVTPLMAGVGKRR